MCAARKGRRAALRPCGLPPRLAKGRHKTARGYYNSGAAGISDTMTVDNTYGPLG